MNSDSHLKIRIVHAISDYFNCLYHWETHFNNIFSFFMDTSIINICHSKDNITIYFWKIFIIIFWTRNYIRLNGNYLQHTSDCIDFVDIFLDTRFIKFDEKFSEHLHDIFRFRLAWITRESRNVGKQHCDILKFFLEFLFLFLVLEEFSEHMLWEQVSKERVLFCLFRVQSHDLIVILYVQSLAKEISH